MSPYHQENNLQPQITLMIVSLRKKNLNPSAISQSKRNSHWGPSQKAEIYITKESQELMPLSCWRLLPELPGGRDCLVMARKTKGILSQISDSSFSMISLVLLCEECLVQLVAKHQEGCHFWFQLPCCFFS